MKITVEVQNVTYFNPENNYLVAKARLMGDAEGGESGGVTTVVGNVTQVTPGETLHLTGEWKDHPKFGRQFAVETFEQGYPATEHGIIRYLSSGMIKGVGPKTAARMVEMFGDKVLDVIDREPEKLLKVKGMTEKKLEAVKQSWDSQREIRNLMLFLQSHDVPPSFAPKIFREYGGRALEKLRANPYDLAWDIRGIGFRTADNMALKIGFARDSQERVEAALSFMLFTMSEQGHLFCPKADLFQKVDEMLGGVFEPILDEALDGLKNRKRVVVEDLAAQDVKDAVYLHHFYRWERDIAARLKALTTSLWNDRSDKIRQSLPTLEKKVGIQLSTEQREAVLEACTEKIFVITGGPGTGKTTITKMVVQALADAGCKVKLAAPTGRAAKRLAEATGFMAQTLHRLMEYAPETGFAMNEERKIKADALLIDEASMLDAQLFVNVLRALPLSCRLILVGDVNQLPSVGPGNILGDILQSETVPSARLTKIFRQAQESFIVTNAHRVNEGKFPLPSPHKAPKADFFWVEQDDPLKAQALAAQLVCERIPLMYGLDPKRDVQVLSPMHKGEVGTTAINELLQQRLNPPGQCKEIVRGRLRLRPGDRVLQTRNNYEKDVFNGDLGWVEKIDPEEGEVLVDYDGRGVLYDVGELDELTLAYCVSVHKSQGSEYPAVIVPIMTQHFMLLQRNLIYTALTRAKRLAVIIGSKRALGMGLKNNKAGARWTHLKWRLVEEFNERSNLFG